MDKWNKILSIPGNKSVIEKLNTSLRDEFKPIGFIGAGMSSEFYPLWGALINKLAKDFFKKGLLIDVDRDFLIENSYKSPIETVDQISDRVGKAIFLAELKKIFSPKFFDDKLNTGRYSSLLKTPFKGFVTTNYDPLLLEARHRFKRNSKFSGYATWKDSDLVLDWCNKQIFKENDCPILFLHGIHERSDTIVIGAKDYERTYRIGLIKKTFEHLWIQEKLVFIGFSFNDPWIDFIGKRVIGQLKSPNSSLELNHIIIMGIPENKPYTPIMRKLYADTYNSEVIFFPIMEKKVGKKIERDYSCLDVLLSKLEKISGEEKKTQILSKKNKDQTTDFWFHETTNDEKFVARPNEFDKLYRWSRDENIKVIGVTGMGGTGKTSLIGHWIKKNKGLEGLEFENLFYWSFYVDPNINNLFSEINKIYPDANLSIKENPRSIVEFLSKRKQLFILDGLEVVQEISRKLDSTNYGYFLDENLRFFIDRLIKCSNQNLLILTSRFPFTNLTNYLGTKFLNLYLVGLNYSESYSLLTTHGVMDDKEEINKISKFFEFHPLALKIYAAAYSSSMTKSSTELLNVISTSLDTNFGLNAKLNRLLVFYRKNLDDISFSLLGIISIFKFPISLEILETISIKLEKTKKIFLKFTITDFKYYLKRLLESGLIIEDSYELTKIGYSCHPIVRDFFRKTFISNEDSIAVDFIDYLGSRPSVGHMSSVKDIEDILISIEILLETNNYYEAFQLFQDRLEKGYLFMHLPCISEGLNVLNSFIGNKDFVLSITNTLGNEKYFYLLHWFAFFNQMNGDYTQAEKNYQEVIKLRKNSTHLSEKENLFITYLDYFDLLMIKGEFQKSYVSLKNADLIQVYNSNLRVSFIAKKAYLESQLGNVKKAYELFLDANSLEYKLTSRGFLYSYRGVLWVRFLIEIHNLRLLEVIKPNQIIQLESLIEYNKNVCRARKWRDNYARLLVLEAELLIVEESLESAMEKITEGEGIIRTGNLVEDLGVLLNTKARILNLQGNKGQAIETINESLNITTLRGFTIQTIENNITLITLQISVLKYKEDFLRRNLIDKLCEIYELCKSIGYVFGLLKSAKILGSLDFSNSFKYERLFNDLYEKNKVKIEDTSTLIKI